MALVGVGVPDSVGVEMLDSTPCASLQTVCTVKPLDIPIELHQSIRNSRRTALKDPMLLMAKSSASSVLLAEVRKRKSEVGDSAAYFAPKIPIHWSCDSSREKSMLSFLFVSWQAL
jgi:hypothetical protein